MDNFIEAIHSNDIMAIWHASRSLLHTIHNIFLPKSITGHPGGDLVSLKKLVMGDGMWAIHKEILGWIFDGATLTLELPQGKLENLMTSIKHMLRTKKASLSNLELLARKLQHATLAIPAKRSILVPLNTLIHSKSCTGTRTPSTCLHIPPNSTPAPAFWDIHLLLCKSSSQPTLVNQLVPRLPSYIGVVDASGVGCGGVWLLHQKNIEPTVWRFEWPPGIKPNLSTGDNPNGYITSSDL